ncbi:protein-L-isoaspartate O-methyltransferase [Uliginosibacterium sp. sgz301328]|uniref:protein-L-isoaspartate O-methyltransferase family protein n=1 Tax=Uliginosibacterium sp. sgz301328 TaxID=3243764 RepID=UPI00359EFAC6
MDFEQARFNMVEQQIRPWEVLNPDVLDTLMLVKRELFVPAAQQALAFADIELPIGKGQTMLAPKIEAKALQALAVKSTDSVLEIGTGSGYMAALLAARAEWVRSIEIEPELAQFAFENLSRNGVDNVIVEEGDGSLGWAERAPYDVIMVSGALPEIPQELLAQLKHGGRLFAVVGAAPVMHACLVVRTGDDAWQTTELFETVIPALRLAQAPDSFRF